MSRSRHTGTMIRRAGMVFVAVTALWLQGSSQNVVHESQAWQAYFNQVRLHDRWAVWTDFHFRTQDRFVGERVTGIIRPAITYYLREQVRITGGYAHIWHFKAAGSNSITQPEHRPWQQLQMQLPLGRSRLTQALRTEQRWRHRILNRDTLGAGYRFNHRVRYNVLFQAPLSSRGFVPRTCALALNNEVHLNFGREVSTFDQNRLFVGLHYHVSPRLGIQFGYMNLLRQLPTVNTYRMDHTVRVFVMHVVDVRRES